MAFPGNNYAPPGVFTRTLSENPLATALDTFKIPVLIGEGNEALFQRDLELVRGSARSVDQRVVGEDTSGRAVVSISAAGRVTLGTFDGVLDRIQIRNFPVVTGDGTGTTTTSRDDVTVTVNGQPAVVRAVDGARGIIQLATPPKADDSVRVTYFFDRTDTLVTDDVSGQVPNRLATVFAVTGIGDANATNSTNEVLDLHDAIGPDAANNELLVNVDGVDRALTLPARINYTMAQVAAAITAARAGTLTATTVLNNLGYSTLVLSADCSLVVKAGSANALLGLVAGQADIRTVTFYVFNGPIVDGTNGGVTTTDPSHVTVKVDNKQIIPVAVDGATRSVTLPKAPKAGAKVTIQYHWNSWQDTFDFLAHVGVSQVTACGDVPGGKGYVQGADFILQNDRIIWGTAATVQGGINTVGAEFFDDTQVGLTLVDNQTYMAECPGVLHTTGGLTTDSRTEFMLPFQPTLGNGRNTPLGQSLFQTLSNNRVDLPVARPDVVKVYWGYDLQDALNRGPVEVLKVEGLKVLIRDVVPVGAKVYATFYYNQLTDGSFTLTCTTSGVSGVGQYTLQNAAKENLYSATFSSASKGVGLAGITIEFPSGSELSPDLRFETVDASTFTGPVDEIATVTFKNQVATPAKYAVPGAGPYEFVAGQSDHLGVAIHGTDIPSTAGLDLSSPSAVALHTGGFFASLVGNEIAYTGGANATAGQSYDLTASESFILTLDNVDVDVKTSTGNNKDAGFIVAAINDAACGHQGLASGGGANTITLEVAKASNVAGRYVGWKVVIGNGAAAATAGQAGTITGYTALGVATVSGNWAGGAVQANDPYYIYDPAARASMKGATRFDGAVTLGAGLHDNLKLYYFGATTGAVTLDLDLGDGPFATPADLAAEVTAKAAIAVAAANANFKGLVITCTADADGRLEFRIQLPGLDSSGYLQVRSQADAATDFAVLAGFDADTNPGSGQAALLQGPVARSYECPDNNAAKPYDRIILRNRVLPGGGGSMAADSFAAQAGISVKTGNAKAGLIAGMTGEAGSSATVHPATLVGNVGFSGGQDGATAEPTVTFYTGAGTHAANNIFVFTMDGIPVTVNLGGSANGTPVNLGPATTASTIIGKIGTALGAVAGNPFGADLAAVLASGLIRQEGAGFRLVSATPGIRSQIVIGNGSANSALGLADGQTAFRNTVSAKAVASALMSHSQSTFTTWLTALGTLENGKFAKLGLASVVADGVGQDYLYLQDAPTVVNNLGAGSTVVLSDTLNGIKNALVRGTGLNALSGSGAAGDPAVNGFTVTSSNSVGSGSANTSALNNDVGQDGSVGQTYRDVVTGLTFTILPRGWKDNPNGPWLAYPVNNATFRINVNNRFTTNANQPVTAIPGVEMTVANTFNVATGDTAVVTCYERGGQEPAIGDLYYVSYVYTKQDFTTRFFSKVSAIEKAFGAAIPDNPVSLASYLAMLNGAVLVGVKQVRRDPGSSQAGILAYRDAIAELEGVLPGHVTPDVIVPMRGDSTELFQVLKKSNNLMSSIRYRAERTSIVGLSAGSLPKDAVALATVLGDTRMRVVYPDMATVSIQNNLGVSREYLVDGTYLAAALAGSVVSPNVDVATPWTGRRLVGFVQLARQLDAVEQNQVAQKGVTVLEDKPPFLRVRHGLTTDMTNVLTKTPTIILIADEVQRQARTVLEQFIGIKFLPGVLSQIEGRLSMMLKQMVQAQIISHYTGVKANVSDDPTTAEVEAYYSPVFPLLYIVLTFHLRAQ